MEELIKRKRFAEIDLSDPFFDSLKEDYGSFSEWFRRKANEEAYVLDVDGKIHAFLYLKKETGPVEDVIPPLPDGIRLKIGTMKINPHGTRLGERFIKKAFDYAINQGISELYVTVFPKHVALIDLFKRYGFIEHGKKVSPDGVEKVFVKSFKHLTGNILLDYPIINAKGAGKYLLAIWPKYHTRLFPDSILTNESYDMIEDVSHTNSIHKMYICSMDVSPLKRGDILVIYRTKDDKGPAWYRSVATSICVVEELKSKYDFRDVNEFVDYCKTYSVFTEDELRNWYNNPRRKRVFVIKMTYNVALRKRLTMKRLVEEVGLDSKGYWGFRCLTDNQFDLIRLLGDVNEGIIVN